MHNMNKVKMLDFPQMGDERGHLVVAEAGGKNIPFDIKRVFYIYGSDRDVIRGQHANRKSEFVLINVAGQSKVRITDGLEEYIVELNKPMMGVYIPQNHETGRGIKWIKYGYPCVFQQMVWKNGYFLSWRVFIAKM